MSTRRFELPGIQDLSKDQEQARALPLRGQHLIVGGPGTGKSVLALIRARQLAQDQVPYCFLVYNHLLNRASLQLFGEDLSGMTWQAWFRAMFKEILDQSVPQLSPSPGNGFRDIDWGAVQAIVRKMEVPVNSARPLLVIDEGQDMPPEFYQVLVDLDFENFFVAADQNQQITEINSSRQDIQDCLGIDSSKVIELTLNHRNNYAVARLAREFYTGDPASPPPELPLRSRSRVPCLYDYEASSQGLETVAERILKWSDRQPNRLIGVLAPKNKVRQQYLEALQSRTADLQWENKQPIIETFYGEHRTDIRFDQGGIIVINSQSCKGLEFDDVILADIDQYHVSSNNQDAIKKLFYVMVARARENVFMFKRKGQSNPIEKILPTDEFTLKREALL